MSGSRVASVRFIFITVFLDALGIGLIVPILPDVIRRFTTDPALVASYFGFFISSYALMQFLASPVLGSMSDKWGRRPVLLLSLLGAAIDYVIMAFAPTLVILFVGRVISGLTGANFTVASAYMADVSDEKNRSANFGMIGAAFGLGFIVGPGLGGIIGHLHPTWPFIAAAVLNLLNFFFGWFVLPESLPMSLRRKIEWKKLNPLASLNHLFVPSGISGLVWVYFFLVLAGQVYPSNWTLFTESQFGWTAFQVGLSLSFFGILMAAAQGGLTRVMIPRFGEWNSLWYAIAVNVVTFMAYAFTREGWVTYPISVISATGGVGMAALQSLITGRVEPDRQGEMQGTLTSLMSLTTFIGPLMFNGLFGYFTRAGADPAFPGAAFVVSALFSVVAAVVLARSSRQTATST